MAVVENLADRGDVAPADVQVRAADRRPGNPDDGNGRVAKLWFCVLLIRFEVRRYTSHVSGKLSRIDPEGDDDALA